MVRLIVDVDIPEIPKSCIGCPLLRIDTGEYYTSKKCMAFMRERGKQINGLIDIRYSKPDWCPIKDLKSKIFEATKPAFSIRAVEAMKDSKLTENMKYPIHTFDSELKPPSEWNKDKK